MKDKKRIFCNDKDCNTELFNPYHKYKPITLCGECGNNKNRIRRFNLKQKEKILKQNKNILLKILKSDLKNCDKIKEFYVQFDIKKTKVL